MHTDMLPYILPLIVLSSALYASVGHGGASAYLAIMTLFQFAPEEIKPVALLLNTMVSSIAFIQYYRAGHFNVRIFLPLALASVPMAFLGAQIPIKASVYAMVLGILLMATAFRLFRMKNESIQNIQPPQPVILIFSGAVIGFFSGLIGIGGGILLSPLLLFLRAADLKTISGISALFIVVNSVSGLLALYSSHIQFHPSMGIFLGCAILGALPGAWLGARKWNQKILRRVLAVVLFFASVKLLLI